MRVVVGLLIAVGLVGAGCAGDSADEPTEVAERMFAASLAGDNETWQELYAEDAVVVFPDGTRQELYSEVDWVVDDFDGDGVSSFADDEQARNALHPATIRSGEVECTELTSGRVECLMTVVDAFVDAGGGPSISSRPTLTIEDGSVVELDMGELDAGMDAVNRAWLAEATSYEEWVSDTAPERYPTMFRAPCCDAEMIMLPESIDQHVELIAEYFAATG